MPNGFSTTSRRHAPFCSRSKPVRYVAVFNVGDEPAKLSATWKQLGIDGARSALDLWSGAKLPVAQRIKVLLPPHGSAVYEVK